MSKIIVLVGASGSGKTTVGKELDRLGAENLLSFTTRAPREGEYNMVDYRFINEAELLHQTLLDNVVEKTEYNGYKYGLLRKDVECALNIDLLYFICDKNGAEQISKMYPEQCSIFFLQVDMETMMDRMLKRGDSVNSVMERVYHAYITDELRPPTDSFVLSAKTASPRVIAEHILDCLGVNP